MTIISDPIDAPAITPPIQVVRYDDLVPCFNAFIDTRTPGSDKKENFTIIGPGVSENPEQYVHIAKPHGFNIGGARQPNGCVNSQHSHVSEEVFFIHSGTWSFDLGEKGEDAKIILNPGDLISIPTHVFRGFENIGEDVGFLWAVLGGDDPGHVLWAPDVFEMANNYGLILLEGGNLIDTNKGETIPPGSHAMPKTTATQVAALKKLDHEQLRSCCVTSDQLSGTERKLLGQGGALDWEHGFEISQMVLQPAGASQSTIFDGPEVVFVHQGELTADAGNETVTMGPGDTATISPSLARRFVNNGTVDANFLVVQGKNHSDCPKQ